MNRSEFRHAVQWIAELQVGRKVRAQGVNEDAQFQASKRALQN